MIVHLCVGSGYGQVKGWGEDCAECLRDRVAQLQEARRLDTKWYNAYMRVRSELDLARKEIDCLNKGK